MIKSFARGIVLKTLGLLSKAAFLFFFATRLVEGQFSIFFMVLTASLIGGRILGMGANDELPFRICGQKHLVRGYFSIGLGFYGFSILPTMAGVWLPHGNESTTLLGVGLGLLFAGNAFIVGSLRSLSNLFQESRANLPWLIVCLLSLLFGVTWARDLLIYLSLSYWLLIAFEVFWLQRNNFFAAPAQPPLFEYVMSFRSWLPKAGSTAALIVSLRAFPIWAVILKGSVSDKLTYSFAIGEIVFQVCMTFVNVLHSEHVSSLRRINIQEFIAIAFLFLISSFLGGMFISYLLRSDVISSGLIVEPNLLIAASVYCGTVAIFALMRVLVWRNALNSGAWRILVLQVVLALVPGAVLVLGYEITTAILIGCVVNLGVLCLAVQFVNLQGRIGSSDTTR